MSRLKNSKRTSKCQVFSFTVPEKMVPFEDIEKFLKKSLNAEKLKGRTLWDFSTSILSQNIKKLKRCALEKKWNKVLQCRKKLKGGPLVQGNNLYIPVLWTKRSNLTPQNFVKLSRTILVSSCGLKKVTSIVAFYFMKSRLKNGTLF